MNLRLCPRSWKVCFTRGGARLQVAELKIERERTIRRRERKAQADELDAYHCPHCDAWHVGRKRRRGGLDRVRRPDR